MGKSTQKTIQADPVLVAMLFLVLSMEDDTVDLTFKTYCKSNWYDWVTSLGSLLDSSLIRSPLFIKIPYARLWTLVRSMTTRV